MRPLDSAPVAFAVATLATPAPDMTALHTAACATLDTLDVGDVIPVSWVDVAPRTVRNPLAFL